MEDLKKIQEFFSKPLNENKITKEDFDKVVKILSKSKYPFTIMFVPKWDEIDIITGQDSPDEITDDIGQRLDSAGLNWGGNSGITISGDSSNYSRREYSDIFRVNGGHKNYFEESVNEIKVDYDFSERELIRVLKQLKRGASTEIDMIKAFTKALGRDITKDELFEASKEEDAIDTITMDVPLFIRVLEYAREDAQADMDLHDLAEKAIAATKQQGLLQMDDYDMLVGEKESVDEKMLVPTDKIDRMARDIAAKYFSSKTDKKDAIEILKQAIKDSYKAIDPEVEIREEEGYSQFLKDDPEHPGGKTKGLTPDVMNKILMKVVQDIEESRPGLWDNIRAKRERGETPSRKGSKAYKSAVKAGKEINKQEK